MYLLLAIVGVIVALVGVVYIFHLRDTVDGLKEVISIRDAEITSNYNYFEKYKKTISIQSDAIKTYRSKNTELTDNVESLRVENTTQAKTIDHHEKLIEECAKKVEGINKSKVEPKPSISTQYPIAPVDISQKKFGRDSKGHFIKRK